MNAEGYREALAAEKQQKLAEFKAAQQLKRRSVDLSGIGGEAREGHDPSSSHSSATPAAVLSPEMQEIARLKAQLAEKDRKIAELASTAASTESRSRASSSNSNTHTSSSSNSSSSREEELKQQLAALKLAMAAKNAAPPQPAPSASAKRQEDLRREIDQMKQQLAAPAPSESAKREAAREQELTDLKEKTLGSTAAGASASAAKTTALSESASRVEELKREIEELRRKESGSSGSAGSASTATIAASDASIASLRKSIEDVKQQLAAPSASVTVSASALRIQKLVSEKETLLKELSSGPSTASLTTILDDEKTMFDKINYGIDVCFLVDCTGSMCPFIEAVKTKVMEVIAQVGSMQKDAYMRFAFVGYRDHCDGDKRIVKVDFVHDIPGSEFEHTLQSCPATGGGDAPEDIAGGLKEVATLLWASSTRLVIHFADAPCHGKKYHDLSDDHSGGDPHGLVPEDLLRILISKRVDYYFMKINRTTDKMVSIFKEVYLSVSKPFTVADVDAAAADFVPKVVNSISSSMERSFGK